MNEPRAVSILLVVLCAVGLFPATSEAVPQFLLLSGNRCVNCHVTNQGSGQRSELGRYTLDGVSLVDPESVGLSVITDALNAGGSGPVSWGFDFRAQTVRSHVSPQTDRRYFPMQAAVYASALAAEWLTIEGSFNFGPLKFDGQQRGSGSAIIQPSFDWPQLRVGFFQPSIGIRFDDHTMFARSTGVASGSQSLVAPNYAEAGAELTYYRYRWLSLSAGVFGAHGLSDVRVDDRSGTPIALIADDARPSILGNAWNWRRGANPGRVNMLAGVSYLVNDDFGMLNLFGGVGYQDRVYLVGEAARHEKEGLREGWNVSVEAGVQLLDPLIGYVRGEQAETTLMRTGGSSEVTTRHLVAGLQVILLPGVELRPEYRLLDTELFRSGRYAVQLHVYR